MSGARSFARELAKRRHPADLAAAVALGGAVLVVGASLLWLRHGPNPVSQGAAALGMAVLLAGGVLLLRRRRRLRRAFAMLQHGRAIDATVTTIRRQWIGRDYVLHFEFRDPNGSPVRARQGMRQEEAFTWHAGDTGIVQDPQQPDRSVWVGRRDAARV